MKLFKTLLLSTLFIMSFTISAFAQIPVGTVVLGDKAYQLEYLTRENSDEVTAAFESANFQLYYKDYDGTWVDGYNNKYNPDNLPKVTYKNKDGAISVYEEKDGDLITNDSFTIIDIN